ncbi:hypothetical protein FB481_11115 [Pseudomonas sp. AG1028]|uniref:Uncharacterized protein n=1 Tax=Pseudomonas straminea TaxID=47882 RepID=A0A1I1Y4G5_PSEOC|nr:hypothetical protein FB481_11115 [Pseudomonas sp. AG1028]SFE13908.1 hypothetical protein SAMN05216372_109142 [Pseudomonas straminea]
MFHTVLIAHRGDQLRSSAATKSKCRAGIARRGDLATENHYV